MPSDPNELSYSLQSDQFSVSIKGKIVILGQAVGSVCFSLLTADHSFDFLYF